jgi:ELWxxDGT repeat protein
MQRNSRNFVKKQPVFVASMLSGFLRISCVAVLLFALGACGPGSDESSSSGSSPGSGSVSGGQPGHAPEIKVLAVDGRLWKTDGTAAGTVLVQDSNTTAVSFPYGVTEFNGAFYFQANDGVNGFELWKTDGTAAGTVLVKDINTGADSSLRYRFTDFTVFNGALYFAADDGVNGFELWKTDGTAAGTVLVQDINTAAGAGSSPADFTVFNGALYFAADDGANSRKLWKTDGTAAGTVLVKDINTVTGTGFTPDDFPRGFPVFNGALYFSTSGGVNGYELWKTDGTAAGTVLVGDTNTAVWGSHLTSGFAVFNGELYFQADYYGQANWELWKTDGTAAGTVLVKDINTENGGRHSDYLFTEFTVFNGALYFQARDNVNGPRLWKTSGTAAGTVLVKDTRSRLDDFTVFNGALYFMAGNGVNGDELWKSDGTTAGTVLVKDTNP